MIKINSFAFMPEKSSAISTSKIIYDYLKKYIRKNHEEYPKYTKEEYIN